MYGKLLLKFFKLGGTGISSQTETSHYQSFWERSVIVN